MNSRDAEKLYSGYLEGELSADEEDALRSFLVSSPRSAADYRAFEATVALVRSLPREEAGDELTLEIMSRVRRLGTDGAHEVVTPSARPRVRRLVPLAAMLGLGFATALFWIRVTGGVSGGDVAEEAGIAHEAPIAGVEVLPEGHGLSDSFDQQRFDRPLRRVDTGAESPSIVF